MRYLNIFFEILFLTSQKLILSSFIKLPIYTYHSSPPNKTTEEAYVTYFSKNNIYTYIKTGLPPQKIVAKLNFDEFPFFIYYNKCEIFSNFNLNESNSYNMIPNGFLLTDVYVYTFLVNDTFYLSDNEKENNTYNLTYLFSTMNNGSYEMKLPKLPYTCAEIGLKLSYPDLKSYNYNFILELKQKNYIKDYIFFFEYNNSNDEEGNLIIGEEPYEYNSDKYKLIQLREINSVLIQTNLYWQLRFNSIYFKKIENNTNNETEIKYYNFTDNDAGLDYSLNIISATYEYREFIEKTFFKEKIKQNLCKMNYLHDNFINYECLYLEDIQQFPTLYFFNRNLGYTFELNYKDLFKKYNGQYISLIWIDMTYRKYWRLGKPFLKNYFFSFNLDKKLISFYNFNIKDNKGNKNNEEENNLISITNIFIIILLLIIFIGLGFLIAKLIYKIKKEKKNKKADELIDEVTSIDKI